MNYGPIMHAVDKLIVHFQNRPAKKDRDATLAWQGEASGLWLDLSKAQDTFYEDVKNGRIEKSD